MRTWLFFTAHKSHRQNDRNWNCCNARVFAIKMKISSLFSGLTTIKNKTHIDFVPSSLTVCEHSGFINKFFNFFTSSQEIWIFRCFKRSHTETDTSCDFCWLEAQLVSIKFLLAFIENKIGNYVVVENHNMTGLRRFLENHEVRTPQTTFHLADSPVTRHVKFCVIDLRRKLADDDDRGCVIHYYPDGQKQQFIFFCLLRRERSHVHVISFNALKCLFILFIGSIWTRVGALAKRFSSISKFSRLNSDS